MTGFVLLWAAITVAVLSAVGTIGFALTDKRLKITRSTVPRNKRWNTALTALLTVCGIVVVAAGILLSSGAVKPDSGQKPHQAASTSNPLPPTHYYVKVNVPEKATQDNPLPSVGCAAHVSGQAYLPPGDGIVIAYKNITNKTEWNFVPNINWSGDRWYQTIFIGKSSDAGSLFQLAVFAMPMSWRTYLATMYGQANPKAGGDWVFQDLPPSQMYPTRMPILLSNKECP